MDRYWEGLLERDPLMGTFIGDERYDDRLPDIGAAGRAEEEVASREALTALSAFDLETLDDADRADADVMRAICERSLARIEQRIDRFEVVNHMHGAGTLLAQVASLQRADTPERVDRYEARLRAFPEMLDTADRDRAGGGCHGRRHAPDRRRARARAARSDPRAGTGRLAGDAPPGRRR